MYNLLFFCLFHFVSQRSFKMFLIYFILGGQVICLGSAPVPGAHEVQKRESDLL